MVQNVPSFEARLWEGGNEVQGCGEVIIVMLG
jgi:hypothetical protein